jgi:hypothetical protein
MTKLRKDLLKEVTEAAGVKQAISIEERRYRASMAFRQLAVDEPLDVPAVSHDEVRESPFNVPGMYVTPKASEGGGQLPMQQQPDYNPFHGITMAPPCTPVKAAKDEMRGPPSVPMAQPQHPLTMNQQVNPQPMGPGMPLQAPAPVPPPNQPSSLFERMSQPTRQSQQSYQEAPRGSAGPPTLKVTFEVDGSPWRQEAFYHAVIRQEANLILVFDRRAVGFPRVFPQETEADMAVMVDGTEVIYLCQVTGIQFSFEDKDFCHMLVKKEFPAG